MMQNHFRKNGDGSFMISKPAMFFITLVLLLLGTLIPIVLGYGKLNERVDVNSETVNKLDGDVSRIDKTVAVTNQRLMTIEEDIDEIKTDVKYIIQELKKGD